MRVQATNAVFLRGDPSTDNPPIRLLTVGTVMQASTNHAWRRVQADDGTQGWVAAEYITEIPDSLPSDEETQYSLADLMPYFNSAGNAHGIDPHFLAAIAYQESGFKNWRVHRDGTGHGLFGFDDNGMLPAFEADTGIYIGRGAQANIMPVDAQIDEAAKLLRDYLDRLGSLDSAAGAWHRGEGKYRDARGQAYAQLIRAHMASLF